MATKYVKGSQGEGEVLSNFWHKIKVTKTPGDHEYQEKIVVHHHGRKVDILNKNKPG